MNARTSAPVGAPGNASTAGTAATVTTSMAFAADPARVWSSLLFYEQIDRPPPWLLRRLLPVPLETRGRKSEVGDEALCLYQGGHLVKRVTGIAPGERYAFEVVEQALDVGGMRLSGGEYRLNSGEGGRTGVSVTTRYHSPRRPRWFWGPVERLVCHAFHRHILRAMRRAAEAGPEGAR